MISYVYHSTSPVPSEPPGSGSAVTVIAHEAVAPLEHVTVIVDLPFLCAVIMPYDTDTISDAELDHDNDEAGVAVGLT